jgi:hypothetical protein
MGDTPREKSPWDKKNEIDLTEKKRDFFFRMDQTMRLESREFQARPMLLIASLVSPRICVEKVNPGMM